MMLGSDYQLQPSQDGGAETGRSKAGPGEAADYYHEKCPVTAVMGLTMRATGEMTAHVGGLFRSKLAIQIFPQSPGNLGTLH
jgi:hypothetical protein